MNSQPSNHGWPWGCLMIWGLASAVAAADIGASETAQRDATAIEWYGYFKFDMSHDSAASSHGNYVLWVRPHAKGNGTSTLNATARQTRLGRG